MSDEPKLPASGSTEPAGLSRALPYLAYAGMFTLLGGGAMFFSAWLYFQFDEALGWPGGAGNLPGILALLGLMRCVRTGRGWRGLLPGFLDTGTATALLIANVAAATVILWAADPALATGMLGWVRALLIGLVLTLPVYIGGAVLMERWLKSDASWKDWFRNENFRSKTGLSILLGLLALVACDLAGTAIGDWLLAVYPAADGFVSASVSTWALMVMFTFFITGPSDSRSALRSIAAALVVFETAAASTVTVGVIAIVLQSDSMLLATSKIILPATVFTGAILLIAHRPGGWADEAADEGRKEEPA